MNRKSKISSREIDIEDPIGTECGNADKLAKASNHFFLEKLLQITLNRTIANKDVIAGQSKVACRLEIISINRK